MTSGTPAAGNSDIALSMRAHDRLGKRCTDQQWLDDTWADPTTRVLKMVGSRFPATPEAAEWSSSGGLPPGHRIFLGEQGGTAHFALLLDDPSLSEEWVTLRQVIQTLRGDDAGLLVHAVALAEWHQSYRFCPLCGGRLEAERAGHLRTCTECGGQQFPRVDPAVIMLVTDRDRALLGRQPGWPEARYSTLAGFVDPGESLEEAVVREVKEEVGVGVTDVTYFGNQPWPFPASLMVGFFAHAVTTEISVDHDEISDARWFTREEMHAQAEAGTIILPGGVTISRSLVETWYGDRLPGQW